MTRNERPYRRKLTEMIERTVRKIIREAEYPYGDGDDGNARTYRGVEGSVLITHGEWADPDILWKGIELNANDVEEMLWSTYKDECEENGEQPTDDGFEAWAEREDISIYLDEAAWAAYYRS